MAEVDDEAEPIRAQPGPQRAFCACPADIAIYGGAAGGGKSWALLLEAAKWVHVRDYRAVLFRKNVTDILGEGGLWDESRDIYSRLGGIPRESPKLTWTFPSGARIAFDHMQHEKSKQSHQGRQYAFIGFDELTHVSESQFWYLLSRARSRSGVRPYIRATCNPDPDSFVRRLIDWWIGDDGYPIPERSGVIRWFLREKEQLHWADTREELLERFGPEAKPKSFTFIRAKLSDNPALTQADPDYEGNLEAMGYIDRERLLGGNWDIKPAAGNYFRRSWFRVIEPEDVPWDEVRRTVRAWDKAATKPSPQNPDPDWTRGAKVSRLEDGRWVIHHVEGLRDTPGRVEDAMKRIAVQDGIRTTACVWQDPGQAGVVDAEAVLKALTGFRVEVVKAAKDKLTYAGLWSPHVERGRVMVVRGAWNDAFFSEAESFPDGGHDDQVDAVSLAFLVLAEIPQYGYTPARIAPGPEREAARSVRVTAGFKARGGAL